MTSLPRHIDKDPVTMNITNHFYTQQQTPNLSFHFAIAGKYIKVIFYFKNLHACASCHLSHATICKNQMCQTTGRLNWVLGSKMHILYRILDTGEYDSTWKPVTQMASHNSKYGQYKHSQLCIPFFFYLQWQHRYNVTLYVTQKVKKRAGLVS